MAVLQQRGGRVSYHDPYVASLPARDWPGGTDLTSTPLTPAILATADCVVILSDHRAFDYEAIARQAKLVVDSRNAIKSGHPNVFKLGAPNRE
jgi:UDP-N-acetyl-D-glucosamine dehydrogenase